MNKAKNQITFVEIIPKAPIDSSLGEKLVSQKKMINKLKSTDFKSPLPQNREKDFKPQATKTKKEVFPPGSNPPKKTELFKNSVETSLEQNTSLQSLNSKGQSMETKNIYAQQLNAYIKRNKFYPRAAIKLNQTGEVEIRLEITPQGHFKNVHISKASAHENLNYAALKLIKRLKHFKPLPKSFKANTSFTIPIVYQITGVNY